MITEERLRELIEQKATIYFTVGLKIDAVELTKNNKPEIVRGTMLYCYCHSSEYRSKMEFENLFETKEEAEWEIEFGNVPRTETLTLPTWKDARKNLEVEIYAPKGRRYLLQTKIMTGYSCDRENPYIIRIDKVGYADSEIDFEYTKENYIEACRLCKKLFLGEKI